MVLDLGAFNLSLDPDQLLLMIKIGGGVFLLLFIIAVFLMFLHWFWLPSRQKKWAATVEYVLLAIDVPKEGEQSPKAVEHIFSTFAGMLSGPNLWEKYWEGQFQLSLSLELVSQEGYIQYIIYTPAVYRDLVEAAFYAQYPDAEIGVVEDYTQYAPQKFPSDSFDLWGSDIILAEPFAYPIRTYPDFEHSLSQELKDPLASLLEEMSRIRKGEYIWLQWVITPTDNEWKKKSEAIVKKIIGEKVDQPKDFAYYLIQPFMSFMKWLGDVIIIQAENQGSGATPGKSEPNKILYLTGGQKDVLQGVEQKMKKTGFFVKGRLIYYARREAFQKSRGVSSILGAINQFNTLHMNSFKKDKRTTTSADYVRVEKRLTKKQNKIIKAYRDRVGDTSFGSTPFVLNIEELATIYHFPDLNIKAPLIKTIESRRSQAPFKLPIEQDSELKEVVQVEDIDLSVVTPLQKSDKPESVQILDQSDVSSVKDDIIKSLGTEQAKTDIPLPSNRTVEERPPVVVIADEDNSQGSAPSNLPV